MNSVNPPTKYLTNGIWIYMVPQFKPESVLILGFAEGTVAGLIRIIWGNDIPITGVDNVPCKPVYGVNFILANAKDFVKTCGKYDVVIVDLYSEETREMCDFVSTDEFVSDLTRIANYIIVDALHEGRMSAYRKLHRYGSNKPNRLANRIYYYGTKDYDDLIIK